MVESLLTLLVPEFKKVYPELLKRMDDADDLIRIQTAKVFSSFFAAIAAWKQLKNQFHKELDPSGQQLTVLKDDHIIELKLDDIHYESIVKGLCLHLDDTNRAIQVFRNFILGICL